MNPIGYIKSPFLFKNGTPRQPSVCKQARGVITIEKSIFNNPEHSLEGLQDFTHVWILFIFHQNNNSYTKAKVKPPRLNGKRVGLFSTRSPYRPNNVGLTLAKIEQIQGASLTVSGIDMIDGTPVIDIKPYITQYDCPSELYHEYLYTENTDENVITDSLDELSGIVGDSSQGEAISDVDKVYYNDKEYAVGVCDTQQGISEKGDKNSYTRSVNPQSDDTTENQDEIDSLENKQIHSENHPNDHLRDSTVMLGKEDITVNSGTECIEFIKDDLGISASVSHGVRQDDSIRTAEWIGKPPIKSLNVRFTSTALEQLDRFSFESQNKTFRLKLLQNSEDAKSAITNILSEDPRSTYRRKHCEDSLYYFTIDVIHVTCWFDDDTSTAEVVRLKPACLVEQCKQRCKPDN